jgi:hypothetical protein
MNWRFLVVEGKTERQPRRLDCTPCQPCLASGARRVGAYRLYVHDKALSALPGDGTAVSLLLASSDTSCGGATACAESKVAYLRRSGLPRPLPGRNDARGACGDAKLSRSRWLYYCRSPTRAEATPAERALRVPRSYKATCTRASTRRVGDRGTITARRGARACSGSRRAHRGLRPRHQVHLRREIEQNLLGVESVPVLVAPCRTVSLFVSREEVVRAAHAPAAAPTGASDYERTARGRLALKMTPQSNACESTVDIGVAHGVAVCGRKQRGAIHANRRRVQGLGRA